MFRYTCTIFMGYLAYENFTNVRYYTTYTFTITILQKHCKLMRYHTVEPHRGYIYALHFNLF
jgi:hypothetical protein